MMRLSGTKRRSDCSSEILICYAHRKYRVLDDCARLRDIVALLPEGRHYSPSLLFINWDAKPGSDVHKDILDMVNKKSSPCPNLY